MTASLLPPESIERLGWVLLHSLWQFAAVALATMMVLRLLSRGSAQVRYAVCCGGLTMAVACAAITFNAMALPSAVSRSTPLAAVWTSALAAETTAQPGPLLQQRVSRDVSERTASWPSLAATADAWRSSSMAAVRPWLPTLVLAWGLGGVLFAVRLALGWNAARCLATVGVTAAPESVEVLFTRAATRLDLRRSVQLWQTARTEVPAVVGCLRPVVVVPASLISGLAPDQLEALLAHELAHVRRHDFLVNLLQTLAETVFFYHPAIWWLSDRIRHERENCCDDLAIAACRNRLLYARALVALEELRSASPTLALGAGGGSLLSRIRRITGAAAEPQPSGSVAATAALALLFVVASSVWATPTAPIDIESASAPFSVSSQSHGVLTPLAVAFADESTTTRAAEPAPEGWFRPDPYSHLGLVESGGAGWHYLRLAGDVSAGSQLFATQSQQQALQAIFEVFLEKDRKLEAELRKQGKVTVPDWPRARAAQWMEARTVAKALLSPEQHERVEQLMIQRLSYHVFRDVRDGSEANSGMRGKALAETLNLNKEQVERIDAAIDAHHKRIRDNQKDLDRATQDRSPEATAEADRVRELTHRKMQLGQQSHRQVWDDVYNIFTPDQRRKFDELRGPAVERP